MLKRQRSYAGYFHIRRDPTGTEMGVVADWLHARFGDPDENFSKMEPRPNPLDPPDVVLTDLGGERIGIEVTELVDGPTISAWEKSLGADYKLYDQDKFYSLLRERIKQKNKAEFLDPPYSKSILIIYSDEPELSRDDSFLAFKGEAKFESGWFDEVWFIMPPKPSSSGVSNSGSECRTYLIAKGQSVNVENSSREMFGVVIGFSGLLVLVSAFILTDFSFVYFAPPFLIGCLFIFGANYLTREPRGVDD